MPGITGIIRRTPREGTEHDLHTMLHAMRHESHYSAGQYLNEELGLYVGWLNHEASFSDCMPLVSPKTGAVLIFHGENYLDSDARRVLRTFGKEVDERNAHSVMDLYDDLGETFLRHLNGWYCGLLADPHRRKITLFNDRYGMARLYFHEGPDEFIFASEAKALLSIRSGLRAIDPESLAEYLRFNCITGPKTFFRGISQLPHAAAWTFEAGATSRRQRYFEFADWEGQPPLAPEEFFGEFAALVSRVFRTYATSSRKVALSLTAGLDTRAIVASLRTHNTALPCYTFDGPWGELFDVRAARRIAQLYGQPFDLIRADGSFFKDFPTFAQRAVYISDGTHYALGAHDVYLNKVAREIAPVRLTGKFGSEVLRARKLVPSLRQQKNFLQPDLRTLVDGLPPFAQLCQHVHPLTRAIAEEIPWHEFGRVSVEQSQLVLRTPYMDNELVKLMFRAPADVRAAGDLQERYIRETTPELSSIPTDLGRFVSNNRLVGGLARTLYWGLFKAEYIYLYALPHWLTRVDRMLEALHPERILAGREKWEAYRIWLKTDLSEFVQQTLLSKRAHFPAFFNRETVSKMVARHLAGTHNYADELNRVLTIELISTELLSARYRAI